MSLDCESSRNYKFKLLASWRIYCTREDQQCFLYKQRTFIDQQTQKSDDKPFWWRSFSYYNRRKNMKIAALSSKFWRQSQIAAFCSLETKWWCTLLLRSWIQLLERLVKPLGLKSQQKRLAKTQALELLCPCGDAVKHVCEIWNIFLLLTRFLCISLNEKLVLSTFSSHF